MSTRTLRITAFSTLTAAAVAMAAACGGGGDAQREKATPNVAKATPNVAKATSVVVIRGNGNDYKQMLVDALKTPNTIVRLLPEVDMDLTGYHEIFIATGVNLTSEQEIRPPVKGAAGKPPPSGLGPTVVPGRTPQKWGPRLYTRTTPIVDGKVRPLFRIACTPYVNGDNVRLFGFRLQGPHMEIQEGDSTLDRGIQIESCLGVEIANMELSGWSGQAIYIVDKDRQLNPNAVRIHDNFIHHNQHVGGNGYGVVTSDGAYALIERNVFDFNRHAIASSGAPGTGYRASLNLVLKGGGVHGTTLNPHTHLFDVHGDKNCPSTFKHIWNCGNAGDQFWYENNAFQFTKDNAIKLRGAPRVAAYINNNVFAHPDVIDTVTADGAISLETTTRVQIGSGATANRAGFDSYGKYGVCDFDGDGKDDLFLPTGVSWWFSSGGRMNWWYLNDAHELLDQVRFGDFDGDKRCDVFALRGSDWMLSSGGSGAWQSLGTYGVPLDQLAFGNFDGDGKTDVFRRAPNGQWFVVSPPSTSWRALNSSSFPLSALRFGDFTGDGITDVLAQQGGRWSISRSGTGSWERLNPKLSGGLESVRIGDLNGNGIDDVVRFQPTGISAGYFLVSWDGRSEWKAFRSVGWQGGGSVFFGRFDAAAGVDLLFVDSSRVGRLFSNATAESVVHNLYTY